MDADIRGKNKLSFFRNLFVHAEKKYFLKKQMQPKCAYVYMFAHAFRVEIIALYIYKLCHILYYTEFYMLISPCLILCLHDCMLLCFMLVCVYTFTRFQSCLSLTHKLKHTHIYAHIYTYTYSCWRFSLGYGCNRPHSTSYLFHSPLSWSGIVVVERKYYSTLVKVAYNSAFESYTRVREEHSLVASLST